MARLAFKPDASFFEKIAIGAVGARAVVRDLNTRGHDMRELENGATATKMWKDVKRKRVRIPDLLCVRCGLRVESRAKSSKPELAVSHSDTDAERAWDYGLVPGDLLAFPVCTRIDEDNWSVGQLRNEASSSQREASYWHSRARVLWAADRFVNYFRVSELRAVEHSGSRTKGVTEGSETAINWHAIFATRAATVESVIDRKIRVQFDGGGSYTWGNKKGLTPRVTAGTKVAEHQMLAGPVPPAGEQELMCAGQLPAGHILDLLQSPERTQRFTGIKLARLRREKEYEPVISKIGNHEDEDIYVRLEAAAYLASVCGVSAATLFSPFLESPDPQVRLEAVVALAAAATPDAVALLGGILGDANAKYFLRSAAAWALGQIGGDAATSRLIEAFADAEWDIREEALEAVGGLSSGPHEQLTRALLGNDPHKAAGAAEAIRRFALLPERQVIPESELGRLMADLKKGESREWIVWLLASLPQGVPYVDTAVAELQTVNPSAHFAMSVLWAFLRSWIAPYWELHPYPLPLRPSGQ